MKLTDFASPMGASNNFIKASFGGFAGSGKTYTATEFIIGCYKTMNIQKPLLLLDNEKGGRFLEKIFNKAGIEVLIKETTQLADVLQSFEFLNKGEIGFLFIDSLSKIWYKYTRDYRAKNKKTFMTLQDWGKILPAWQEEFSDRFVELNGNCVFTGRGGFNYEMEEDEEGKKAFVKSGVKMKLAGETPFEPDLNIWMELKQDIHEGKLSQWREAQILKDRSQLIDGKTFKNPKYKDFEPVVKFLTNVKVTDIKGATNNDNLAPSENYSYLEEKQRREIELEKIKAVFDKSGLGTSKEEKALKVLIYEKIIGTTSSKELESYKSSQLNQIRITLDSLFSQDWFENQDKFEYVNTFLRNKENEDNFDIFDQFKKQKEAELIPTN